MTKVALSLLEEEVSRCVKCPELAAHRTKTVFSDGNPTSKLLIIGESPGRTEDERGIPFVGDAGQLLDNVLKACQLDRNKVFIVNSIKCRPPGNRNPTDEELGNCRGFLDRQIEIVQPKFILVLGSVTSKNLFGDVVSALRGRWHTYREIPSVVTYHPAFILRNSEYKKELGQDLRLLLDKMNLSP